MSIKIGLIGAGGIGKTHLEAASQTDIDIVCIADIDIKAADKLAKAYDVVDTTTSAQEVFDNPDIDAVIIGVPNKFHKELAVAALLGGKDVLLEKPMGLNAAECRTINDAAERKDRIVQIGFVHRYDASSQMVKSFIDAGRAGTIYHAKANYYRRRGIPGLGGWFTTKAVSGGGPLIDLGVHVLDLTMYLMGYPRPKRVSGKVYANFGPRMKDYVYESMWAGPPKYDGTFDVEDAAHALIRLEGGATLELNTTWAGNLPDDMPNMIGLFGDKAGITFKIGGDDVRIMSEDMGRNVDVVPKLRSVERFQQQLKSFVHCVATRENPYACGECGQIVQSIIDAIYESSIQDREVEI